MLANTNISASRRLLLLLTDVAAGPKMDVIESVAQHLGDATIHASRGPDLWRTRRLG